MRGSCRQNLFQFFANDVIAEFHTFVTDVNAWPRNQFANLVLAFTAERTVENFAVRACVILIAHFTLSSILRKILLFFVVRVILSGIDQFIDQTILLGFFRTHEVVTLGITGDSIDRLAGM